MLGSPQIGIGASTQGDLGGTSGGSTSSHFNPLRIPKTLAHLSNASSYNNGIGSNTSMNMNSDHQPQANNSDVNAMGQQFLSSAGIDTKSLFRKARGLQAQTQTRSQPFSSQGNGNINANPNNVNTSSYSNANSIKLHANLYTSIEEMRAATISNILLNQRNKTNQIVQNKIKDRLQAKSKMTQSKSSYLGSVIPGTGRRVLPFPASEVPLMDMNHDLIRSHLNSRIGASATGITLDGLEKIARENGNMAYSYHNAISLLQMLRSQESEPNANQSPHGKTISCVKFLAQQFKNYIIQQVKNNPMSSSSSSPNASGIDVGAGGLLGYIYKFVELEMGRSVTHQGQTEVLWKILYYSLRCGDLDCVRQVIASSQGQIDPIIIQYVEEMCKISSTGAGTGVEILEKIPDGLINAMAELYRRVESRRQNQSSDYELVALGMMSFTPMDGSSTSVSTTIEDYLFLGLWNAIRVRSDDECVDKVFSLAENVKHWGPEYFEDGNGDSDGWSYAMPLLLCQQTKSALSHLAGKSGVGLCLAVQLSLAIRGTGITLEDLTKTTENSSDESGEEEFLAALIIAFAKNLQTIAPEGALDYLVHVPGKIETGIQSKAGKYLSKNAESQICRLLLDTKAFTILGGRIAADGSRLASGALDEHFGKGAVSGILALTADQSIREGRVADAAELLSLAGKYSDLLSVLNRQLASLLVTNKTEERVFWRNAAERFYSTYLRQGQTHVVQVLEVERNLSLGENFQMLLNLLSFFDRCSEGNWVGAWDLVDNLGILPNDERDVASKVDKFNSLSLSIQNEFHHIVSKAMEALSEQHGQLKRSLGVIHQGGMGSETTNQRMFDLRNRARLLVTFAGLISLSDTEVKAKILRLEARMI